MPSSTSNTSSSGVGTVLVTGAASGLGAAVVAAVPEAGGRPLGLDRVPVEGVPHEVVDLADTRAAEAAVQRLVDGAGGSSTPSSPPPAPTSAARSPTSTAPTGTASSWSTCSAPPPSCGRRCRT